MSYVWTAEDLQQLKTRPLDEAETIPAHWYTDRDLLALEIDHILAASWQYIGHESQIPRSGDFIVGDILGKPVIVIRHSDGGFRCLANVCRHRAGPLATADGNARILRCQYHAWTYNLDGVLIGAPKFDGAKNFDKSKCSLPNYRLESYQGFLFVNLSGTAEPLSDHLKGIREAIAPIDLSRKAFHKRVVYKVQCNWKVYIDNFMEGYHIYPVHPTLAKILDVSGYTTTIERHMVLQYGPLAGEDNPYNTGGAAYYYQVFPNLMLNILPGRVQVNSIVPAGVDACYTIFDYYYAETDPEKLSKRLRDDLEISDVVQKEDIGICEQVQRGLMSGSYIKGRVCPEEERGVWAFQNQLRKAYKLIEGQSH